MLVLGVKFTRHSITKYKIDKNIWKSMDEHEYHCGNSNDCTVQTF